jgi:hypothetical protein
MPLSVVGWVFTDPRPAANRLTAILTVLAQLLSASSAFAWNDKGHMVVAFIAYKQLKTPVQSRVDALLKLNPFFSRWVGTLPVGASGLERRAMLFAIAATWPDHIKSSSQYTDDGTENGNRPDGPPSSQNTGYGDKLRHKYWHFVDQPFSTDSTPLPPVPDPNAQDRIHLFRSVLTSEEADPLKSYDLVWLLHLVGDVHQPLHDSTRVSAALPAGDSGGNLVLVCASPCNTTTQKLHAFWDDALGSERDVGTAVTFAKSLPPADAQLAAVLDEGEWVREGLALAKSNVYRPPIGSGGGPFTLTASYRNATFNLAAKRVALAGARLADVLNAELR